MCSVCPLNIILPALTILQEEKKPIDDSVSYKAISHRMEVDTRCRICEEAPDVILWLLSSTVVKTAMTLTKGDWITPINQ